MTEAHTEKVRGYFAAKASDYDRVDEQLYWRLSDDLLWEALRRYVLPHVVSGAKVLDAGGGTGRWSDRLLRADETMLSVLFDLSPAMTRHAIAKAVSGRYVDRLTVLHGDLIELHEHVADEQFDLAISFHNVLGFVDNAPAVLRQIAATVKPGGQVVLVVPNRYHVVFFNILTGAFDEAENAAYNRSGRFTPDMPAMNLFTPVELVGTLNEIGLPVSFITGFPVAIYPGFQETQLAGNSMSVDHVLADDTAYERVKTIELRLMGEPGLAERGNNLFVVARKRS